MAGKKKKSPPGTLIAQNKRARHDYVLEEQFEAGLVLKGWEVKALREGKVQMVDSYVLLRNGEAWLLGVTVTPLVSASTHVVPEPQRTRKLLLHAREIARLFSATQAQGYSCVATRLYWKDNKVKCELALGKGKKQHDKRQSERNRDWDREKQRLMKQAG